MADGPDFESLKATVCDAVYVLIGFGLMGLGRLEAQRRALQAKLADEAPASVNDLGRQLSDKARSLDVDATLSALRQQVATRAGTVDTEAAIEQGRTQLARRARQLDGLVEMAATVVEAQLAPYEGQLPAPARDALAKVHEQARAVRAEFRRHLPDEPTA
jgi:hypothetical protein